MFKRQKKDADEQSPKTLNSQGVWGEGPKPSENERLGFKNQNLKSLFKQNEHQRGISDTIKSV